MDSMAKLVLKLQIFISTKNSLKKSNKTPSLKYITIYIILNLACSFIKNMFHQWHTLRSETIFGNWKPFKNAFYFPSKTLFVLKIFKFLSDFLVVHRNGLIKKIQLISNFMTSQPG